MDEDEDELPLVIAAKKKKETQPVDTMDTVDTGSATGGQGKKKTFSRGCQDVL